MKIKLIKNHKNNKIWYDKPHKTSLFQHTNPKCLSIEQKLNTIRIVWSFMNYNVYLEHNLFSGYRNLMIDSLNIKTYTKFIDWGSNDIINLEGIQLMISIKRPEHIFKKWNYICKVLL